MRRFDDPPIEGQYYKHRPGAYGVFFLGNQLLLTAQMTDTIEFQLPGGGIEAGENPITALVREAYEETGWKVQVAWKIGTYKRYVYMPEYEIHAEKICHIYVGRAILRHGEPPEADHFAAIFPVDEAADLLINAGDRAMLKRLL